MRIVSALAYILACIAVSVATGWTSLELVGFPVPPSVPAAAAGSGYRLERGGQHVLHLSGSPYAMGHKEAQLVAGLLRRNEAGLIDALLRRPHGVWGALALQETALLALARHPLRLPLSQRRFFLGLADGTTDPFAALGPHYSRLVAYHAAAALARPLGLVQPIAGCSSVAVAGARGDGHALMGHNFGLDAPDSFDTNKLVVAVQPQRGFGFVHVTWAGMVGVVSGMNERGLAISLNAAATSEPARSGSPISLLVRRALEHTASVDAAIAFITAAQRCDNAILSLADRHGRVAVLELTPSRWAVRRGAVVLAADHLESPSLAVDPVNRRRRERTASLARRQRMAAIVRRHEGPWKIRTVLRLLRDRNAADGETLPLGHRHAIDDLRATHSVIFDATAGRLWVSAGPHTLGPYLGYDVARLVHAASPTAARGAFVGALPADPLRSVYPFIQRSRVALQQAVRALDDGDVDLAARALHDASPMADHPLALWLRGRLNAARGDTLWARKFYQQALLSPPETTVQRDAIRAALARLPRPDNTPHAPPSDPR